LSGDESVQEQLINSGYIQSIAFMTSLCSGCSRESTDEISLTLQYFSHLISQLNHGRSVQNPFPPQPTLAKISGENIEECGFYEEIDGQLINLSKFNSQIVESATLSKSAVQNIYIDPSNPRPYLYKQF
ncbi:MAG: hypothetical protein EZS28_044817, partial [Streblomastix strix]